MPAEAQPVPPTADATADHLSDEAPSGPTTGERIRSAARRARSIWCGILSGLG